MKKKYAWLLSSLLTLTSVSATGAETQRREPISAEKLDVLYEKYCEWDSNEEIGAPRTFYHGKFRELIRTTSDVNLKRTYVLACLAAELDSRVNDFAANRKSLPREPARNMTESEREKARAEIVAMLDDLAALDPADSSGAIARYRPLAESVDKGD